jgi:hypothetical protein
MEMLKQRTLVFLCSAISRKMKVVVCECGRERQGKRWGRPGKKLHQWFAEISGRGPVNVQISIGRCPSCLAKDGADSSFLF